MDVPNMFRVWLPRPGIAVSPLADFTPSPNTRDATQLLFQETSPWVDTACADCPGFLVLGVANALASSPDNPYPLQLRE